MARERIHADAADKQRAYRERQAARRAAAGPGYTDAELAQAARDLHAAMQYAASVGGAAAALVVGQDTLETLRNAASYLVTH